jgi:hypothetical protein
MHSHIKFVAALFVVWGALTALVGLSVLALGVGAASFATAASRGGQVAAGLTAAALAALAIIAIAWGVAHVFVGLSLRKLRLGARLLALMLGSVDLLLLPYGTALGVYALWVLLSEGGKAVFNESPSAA